MCIFCALAVCAICTDCFPGTVHHVTGSLGQLRHGSPWITTDRANMPLQEWVTFSRWVIISTRER